MGSLKYKTGETETVKKEYIVFLIRFCYKVDEDSPVLRRLSYFLSLCIR